MFLQSSLQLARRNHASRSRLGQIEIGLVKMQSHDAAHPTDEACSAGIGITAPVTCFAFTDDHDVDHLDAQALHLARVRLRRASDCTAI